MKFEVIAPKTLTVSSFNSMLERALSQIKFQDAETCEYFELEIVYTSENTLVLAKKEK